MDFSKILEKLMFNRLTAFLDDTKALTGAQNGFRKGKCIETAVQSFIQQTQEALDKRAQAIGIFIDLSKVYDTLNHTRLLEKLVLYGIRGVAYLWFKSYLTHRRQYTEVKQGISGSNLVISHKSSLKDIKQGVPQGSVLAPLLFFIYVNDLPLNINNANVIMFADDINVLIIDRDKYELQQKINKVTTELETWIHRNNLVINIE